MVSELRRMNDEVFENQRDEDNSIRDSEPFKKEYAAVLLQLSQVNDQVLSHLLLHSLSFYCVASWLQLCSNQVTI